MMRTRSSVPQHVDNTMLMHDSPPIVQNVSCKVVVECDSVNMYGTVLTPIPQHVCKLRFVLKTETVYQHDDFDYGAES